MAIRIGGKTYRPGAYSRPRADIGMLAQSYIQQWQDMRRKLREQPSGAKTEMAPSICISRKIGVGALEIADILAEKLGYQVVDREILETIAQKGGVSRKTAAFFDESHPGAVEELLSFLFRERSFVQNDYTRLLFSAVLRIARSGPTLFVGRGTHLILPREKVLAVRFIGSASFRSERLARILAVSPKEAAEKLAQLDQEQNEFFKKVYRKKAASPYEFDLIINRDYLGDPKLAARMVADAFNWKFARPAG